MLPFSRPAKEPPVTYTNPSIRRCVCGHPEYSLQGHTAHLARCPIAQNTPVPAPRMQFSPGPLTAAHIVAPGEALEAMMGAGMKPRYVFPPELVLHSPPSDEPEDDLEECDCSDAERRCRQAAHELRNALGNGVIDIPKVLGILEGAA
jgi:hypothetical protein